MSGASFMLFVNLTVGLLLCAFFLVLAVYDRRLYSARWFTAAYALGVTYVVGEIVIPFLEDARPVLVLSSTAFVAGISLLNVGIARRYEVKPNWALLGIALAGTVLAFVVSNAMPRESLARNFVYQSPFFVMQAIGVWIVLSSGSRKFIDVALATFLGLTSLHYLSKPFGAVMLGGPGERPQDYVGTAYAMFSQSLGAVFVIATALVLMAMLVSDLLRDVTRRSVTDPLTGLLNRRGFEEQLAAMVARHGRGRPPLSLVLCDLDGFKAINDAHGHAAGDRVIESFAGTLREATAGLHVVGRIGGEEYAVVLSNCNVATARLFAESVRAAFAATRVEGFDCMTRFTASFGVATLGPEETPASLLERADAALYVAKRAGRNCVRVSRPSVAEKQAHLLSAG